MQELRALGVRKGDRREGRKRGSSRTTGVCLDREFWEVEPTSDLSLISQTTGLFTTASVSAFG